MKKLILILTLSVWAMFTTAQDVNKAPYINTSQVIGTYSFGENSACLISEGTRGIDQTSLYTLRFLDENATTKEIILPINFSLYDVESSANNSVLIFNGPNETVLVKINIDSEPLYINILNEDGYRFSRVTQSAMSDDGKFVLIRDYSKMGADTRGREIVTERGYEYISLDARCDMTASRKETYEEKGSLLSIYPTSGGFAYISELANRKKDIYNLTLTLCDKSGEKTGEYQLASTQTYFPSDVIYNNGNFVLSGYYLSENFFKAKKNRLLMLQMN